MRRDGDLFPQVVDFHALRAAARRAARSTPTGAPFLADLEANVLALRSELLAGTWRPGPPHTFAITDPKPRIISAAPFVDRVVHHALCAALEPTLERYAIHHSYACRHGKGNRTAVAAVQRLAGRHAWFVKLDVRHYFETMDHSRFLAAVALTSS